MSNSLAFLRRVMSTLAASGLDVLAFGGWAEELLQISPPRSHGDIDLLVIADAGDVDIALRGRDEVTGKRFSHKRAFIEGGTLVELFLVQRVGATETTTFWNAFTWTWPTLSPLMVEGLAVAPPTALHAYRKHHADIASHRAAAELSPVPIESCGLQPGDLTARADPDAVLTRSAINAGSSASEASTKKPSVRLTLDAEPSAAAARGPRERHVETTRDRR